MARINKTQYAILGCLSIKPMTAYDIKHFMAKTTAYFWTEREGQLYPTLNELTEKQFVTFAEQEAAKVGTKKIYQITRQGQDYLQTWLAQPVEPQVYRNELLLKLFFGNHQSKDNNLTLLKTSLAELQHSLTLLEAIELVHASHPRKLFQKITLDYGITLLQAEMAWCRQSIALLEQSTAVLS